MNTKKIIKIVTSALLLLLITFGFLQIKQLPKFSYKLQTYELTQDMKELPMEVTPINEAKGFTFKVIFTDDRANTEKARLDLTQKFERTPPFLTYGDEITIQLVNTDQESAEDQVKYEVSGEITGLKTGQYKLKIIDPNSNLVDERVVIVE